jgi:hypothetical protein
MNHEPECDAQDEKEPCICQELLNEAERQHYERLDEEAGGN